jgi:hypothetical protein
MTLRALHRLAGLQRDSNFRRVHAPITGGRIRIGQARLVRIGRAGFVRVGPRAILQNIRHDCIRSLVGKRSIDGIGVILIGEGLEKYVP